MRKLLWILAVSALPLGAEIIDRIAVAVDDQVITTSQVNREIRVVAFLNGEKPDFSPSSRRMAAGRLIDQLLVEREMQLTHFPQPDLTEARRMLKQVQLRAGSDAAWRQALANYGITEAQVLDSFRRQATLLRFIDLRFRPEVQAQDVDVQRYFDNVYLPEARKKGITPEPVLDDVRQECEEAVTARLVDQRVEAWLAESRGRAHIVYEEEAFQ